jgi:hypothetical protein
MFTAHLGEVLSVCATVDPQTTANTEKFTDVIDMSKYDQVLGIALTGDMASETIDFRVVTCDSGGANPVALKACAQLTASAGANDGAQLELAVRSADLNANGEAARYIKFGLVTGGATGGPCAVVVVGIAHAGLASANDLSTVAEIKY